MKRDSRQLPLGIHWVRKCDWSWRYMWSKEEMAFPSCFNVLKYVLNKHKIRQLMMGNKQVGGEKKKGFWELRAPKWVEWAQEKGMELSISERARCFQKTSGGDLLREVSWWRSLPLFSSSWCCWCQHARARRRMRLCNECVGPQRECEWKRWGDLCIQSISKRIWRSWKGDSDLELLGVPLCQSLPFTSESTWISNLWTTPQTSCLCPQPFKDLPLPGMPWEDVWAEAIPPRELQVPWQ